MNSDLFGSVLTVTAFIQDGPGIFTIDRPGVVVGTRTEGNERYGIQTTIETPLSFLEGSIAEGAAIVYGIDYQDYEYFRTQILGPEPQNGVPFPDVGETSWAAHAQARIPLGDKVVLTGGFRAEQGEYDLSDVPVRVGRPPFEGGKRDFDVELFNAAVLLDLNDEWSTYLAFSQSAGVLDAGRGSRNVNRAADLQPELDPTNQYEIGFRANYDELTSTFAVFYSESDLGQSFVPDPDSGLSFIVPAPVEIWGAEFTIDARLSDNLDAGGTLSFSDGNEEPTGTEVSISHLQIQPLKITGYVDYTPIDGWRNRLSVTHQVSSDAQNDRIQEGLRGGLELDTFTFINLFSSFELGNVPGRLDIGIENLFDRREVDFAAQGFGNNAGYYLYPGRRVRIDYSIDW